MNLFKAFFLFNRAEKRGIIVLASLVLALGIAYPLYRLARARGGNATAEELERQQSAQQEYETFKESIRTLSQQQPEPPYEARSNSKRNPKAYPGRIIRPVPFNPNTADSLTLLQLGLPQWMAHNVIKYRQKGGRFRTAADFRKAYGMDDELFARLLPYIELPEDEDKRQDVKEEPQLLITVHKDSSHIRSEKYAPGTLVDLNLADTTELKKIPGIGSVIARMIVEYRQRLGGFYALSQLREIRIDHTRLAGWFVVDPQEIRRINLNQCCIERLYHHPYFNFYQAKAIVEYRRKRGKLNSLKPFSHFEEFSETDLEKISHYVCFE